VPDDVSAFFWAAAAEGRLEVQRCNTCGHHHHPPAVACSHCLGDDLGSEAMSGRATVFSYTVARQPFHAGFVEDIPYVVALVALDDDPTVKLLTNIVDVAPEDVSVGLAVEVTFEPAGDQALPVFRPC
jgi:uncharacterized OB-fold protein